MRTLQILKLGPTPRQTRIVDVATRKPVVDLTQIQLVGTAGGWSLQLIFRDGNQETAALRTKGGPPGTLGA